MNIELSAMQTAELRASSSEANTSRFLCRNVQWLLPMVCQRTSNNLLQRRFRKQKRKPSFRRRHRTIARHARYPLHLARDISKAGLASAATRIVLLMISLDVDRWHAMRSSGISPPLHIDLATAQSRSDARPHPTSPDP
jgi:hypothetical protein